MDLASRMTVQKEAHVSPLKVPGNLIGVLRRHAEERPDKPIFVYSLEDQSEQATLTYAQFDRRARAYCCSVAGYGLCRPESAVGLSVRP